MDHSPYPDRIVPRAGLSAADATALQKRTLTNLHNQPPAWLTMAHEALDAAVAAALRLGRLHAAMPDDEILRRLLALNLARAAAPAAAPAPRQPQHRGVSAGGLQCAINAGTFRGVAVVGNAVHEDITRRAPVVTGRRLSAGSAHGPWSMGRLTPPGLRGAGLTGSFARAARGACAHGRFDRAFTMAGIPPSRRAPWLILSIKSGSSP